MKRLIIAGTIGLLTVIILNTAFIHDDLLSAFASSDPSLQVLRMAAIGLLMALLLTSPPRSMHLRAILGGASLFLVGGVVSLISHYSIGVLDALLFMEVAIILAIDAIESPSVIKTLQEKGSKIPHSATRKVSA